jgi:5-methylcytosine-specific restriction protein A
MAGAEEERAAVRDAATLLAKIVVNDIEEEGPPAGPKRRGRPTMFTGNEVERSEFGEANTAIRDYGKNGTSLHLFEYDAEQYRYQGQFSCASWSFRNQHDGDNGSKRNVVFHLVPHGDKAGEFDPARQDVRDPEKGPIELQELRDQALEASTESPAGEPRYARRLLSRRSNAVRTYVLARASGKCEACQQPAPF